MEKLREHLGSDGLPAKAAVKRLATDAALTTGELRDFVRNLKGRSPQEVMGIVSSSALAQAVIGSTIGSIVLIGVLTIGPYVWYGPPKAKAAKPVAAVESEPTKVEPTKSANSSGTPSEEDVKKASKAMGLDETKMADPKKNPLDTFDNLLDKVK